MDGNYVYLWCFIALLQFLLVHYYLFIILPSNYFIAGRNNLHFILCYYCVL